MKRLLVLLLLLFSSFTYADTINLHWLNEDGTTYQNSTCVIDSDLILPATPPTKYGYTFTGWKMTNYVPIEYLESTGTQWIDTGIVADETTEAEIDFKDAQSILFMVSTGEWYSNNFGIVARSGANYIVFYMNCDGYTNYSVTSKISGNIKLLLDGIYLNDTKLTITSGNIPASTKFTTTYTIPIFARKWQNVIQEKFSYKLNYFKLWQNNILVRDFIPVLDGDGTPCMFDRVTGQFFYNQGTGKFIAGPVLTE